jgi:hypothetical protein
VSFAAYCASCQATVWIGRDGDCVNGHARSCLRGIHEAQQDPETGKPLPLKGDVAERGIDSSQGAPARAFVRKNARWLVLTSVVALVLVVGVSAVLVLGRSPAERLADKVWELTSETRQAPDGAAPVDTGNAASTTARYRIWLSGGSHLTGSDAGTGISWNTGFPATKWHFEQGVLVDDKYALSQFMAQLLGSKGYQGDAGFLNEYITRSQADFGWSGLVITTVFKDGTKVVAEYTEVGGRRGTEAVAAAKSAQF